ncbi:MAG: hypothetical protein JWO13_1517 [Acidobacteriales bacterium]|nr:hypothetical protein [Terriglobales bacterium]
MKTKTNNKTFKFVIAALALLAIGISSATAQKRMDPKKPYCLIFGTVFGPDELPAAGVKVKIRRADEKKPIELVSDRRGEFAQRFPAGTADYLIWADLKDKQAAEKTQVKVHVEKDERQDVTLHLIQQSSKK